MEEEEEEGKEREQTFNESEPWTNWMNEQRNQRSREWTLHCRRAGRKKSEKKLNRFWYTFFCLPFSPQIAMFLIFDSFFVLSSFTRTAFLVFFLSSCLSFAEQIIFSRWFLFSVTPTVATISPGQRRGRHATRRQKCYFFIFVLFCAGQDVRFSHYASYMEEQCDSEKKFS